MTKILPQDLADLLVAGDLDVIRDALTDGAQLLVDGSAFSPSWRALSGGAKAHDLGIGELYEEALDRATDELDVAVTWDEGCLWRASSIDPEEPAE